MTMGASFCPSCGRMTEAESRFCRNCGATLEGHPPTPPPVPPSPPKSFTEQYGSSQPIPPTPPAPTPRSGKLRPMLLVGGLVLLAIAGALVFKSGGAGGGAVPTSTARAVVTVAPGPTFTVTPTDAPTEEPVVALPSSFATLSDRNWAKVVKTPDNYIGNGYQIWACITQFDAATGSDGFRADASNKNLKDEWYLGDNAVFTGDTAALADFVEDDVVVMNVVSLGSYSYDTQTGGNTTVPSFEVVKITNKGSCA